MQRQMGYSLQFKIILVTLVLWGISSVFLVLQSRTAHQNLVAVEELGNRVNDLRSTLYFPEPFRAVQVDDIALDVQLIYSLRLQVESNFKSKPFLPDVNQLLYVTDRFLEDVRDFLSVEIKVKNLAQDINESRAHSDNSEQVVNLYNEISAYTFQALYAESQSNSEIYRAFDRILIASQALDQDERKQLQVQLSSASVLLSEYAQVNYYVEKLIKHSVHDQLSAFEDELHDMQGMYMMLAIVLSFIALSMLTFIRFFVQTSSESASAVQNGEHELIEGGDGEPLNDAEVMAFSEERATEAVRNTHDIDEPACHQPQSTDVLDSDVLGDSDQDRIEKQKAIDAPNASAVIDIEAMLATMNGDDESVAMLLEVFVQDHTNDAISLRELLDTDLEAAQRKAHSLKGVAGSLGAMPLREIATEIEIALKQSEPVSEAQLSTLSEALADAISATKEYLQLD